ncbi:MAG: serine hydrolase domain-containing protein [Rhodothermales bacterium]
MTLGLRLFFVLFLFALQPATAQELPIGKAEDHGMSSERLKAVTSLLEDYTDSGQMPGAVISVMRDGVIVHEAAVGMRDREAAVPLAKDDIFRIASQTKAVVSVGIMILQERGQLLITDAVGAYLPEYMETTVAISGEEGYEVVPASRPITIRDLLTHTAGIGYGYGPASDRWQDAGIQGWYFAHYEEPIRETVRRMASLPMDAHPGTEYVYGYNTDILGALIEVVSGQPLDAFLAEHVFEPLDMRDTYFYLPESKRDRLAVVYSLTPDSLVRSPNESAMEAQGAYVDGPSVSFSGGAGLLSTARDYARFLQMLLNAGQLNDTRILSPTSVRSMTTDHLDDVEYPWGGGVGFGLGFYVVDDLGEYAVLGSVGEYGWGGAYHSVYWVDPAERLVVVYFTQVVPAPGLDDHAKIRAMVYGSLLE